MGEEGLERFQRNAKTRSQRSAASSACPLIEARGKGPASGNEGELVHGGIAPGFPNSIWPWAETLPGKYTASFSVPLRIASLQDSGNSCQPPQESLLDMLT